MWSWIKDKTTSFINSFHLCKGLLTETPQEFKHNALLVFFPSRKTRKKEKQAALLLCVLQMSPFFCF